MPLTQTEWNERARRIGRNACQCGCGNYPRGVRSRFVPGHDMRVHSPRRAQAAVEIAVNNRRFGVEIECVLPGGYSRDMLQQKFRVNGLIDWRVTYDGSLSGNGAEVVSPPIQGEDGMDQLRKACRILNEIGATVDRRCGLHVHIDLAGVGAQVVRQFVRNYATSKTLIDGLVSTSRRTGNCYYAEAWTPGELSRLDSAGTLREMSRVQGTRYRCVNLAAYAAHGTIEIRQHQGTTNFKKIEAWVQFLMTMLAASREQIVGATSVQALTNSIRLDEDNAAYLIGRAVQFGYAPAV